MRKLPQFLFRCSLFAFMPIAANAAGTYYTGNYQSPQSRYTQKSYNTMQGNYTQNSSYSRSAGYVSPNSGVRYNTGYNSNYNSGNVVGQQRTTMQQPRVNSNAEQAATNGGFYASAGLSRQVAKWNFELNESGSILHYDDINWNVFDLKGGYLFNLGNTKMQVDAGLQYGIQAGESTMIDDDITNGGYFITKWVKSDDKSIIGNEIGHALSIGTSDGGSMLGINVGLGLTDFFKWGNVSFTPSIGYRYLKYKLETKKNYGLAVDTAACFQIAGSDEIQCDPAIVVDLGNGEQQIIWRDKITDQMKIANGEYLEVGDTYYYQQPGTSHSYEVEWSGPYIAMDMDYQINKNNSVNGRVELGFPGYTSTGDQPYRSDWQHPKSVEDKAGMFSALHLGLGANWSTALTDSVALSIGITYDYYTVSDADAKTYLNSAFYNEKYNERFVKWGNEHPNANTEAHMLGQVEGVAGDPIAMNIKQLEAECPGWVCSSNGEIDSFYKSLGVRVGINAKF